MSISLQYKPDFDNAKRQWLAFWEQELIDRPCCMVRAPREGIERVPEPRYLSGAREDFRPIVEQAVAHAATVWWGGDAMPYYTPSFGPDMMAAWLGADLHFDPRDYGTSWVVACIDDWDRALPLTLDPNNVWWRRMLDFCAALAAAFEGKMMVAHLDLHSNMDALAAMREPSRLCLDLMDVPHTIDRAMRDLRGLYRPIYDALYQAGRMDRYGTCGCVPAYHPVRTNTIQCDFAALIGPDHFKRFVMPALEEEVAHLGHCVFHFDGPECLVHLDDICSIDELHCIQWVAGARNKAFIAWLDLLKEIQAKGKSLWVPCDPESIKVFHRELKPNMVFYDCCACDQRQGEEVLRWLVANT